MAGRATNTNQGEVLGRENDAGIDLVGNNPDPNDSSRKKPARLSINISKATEEALLELSKEKDVSITEAVRRLIGYGSVIYRAVRDGGDVLIRGGDGETERVVLLD